MHLIKPSALKKGDTLAIIAPSSSLSSLCPHRVERAKEQFEKMGFRVKLYPTLTLNVDGKAGSADQRVKDIHDAFSNVEVKGIICAIGGECADELLDLLDYDLIRKNPKVFCGYSDISKLHYAIQKKSGLVTFYGPSAMNQFAEYPEPLEYTLDYFLRAVTSTTPMGLVSPSAEWTDEVLNWFDKTDLTRPRVLKPHKGYTWLKPGSVKAKIVGGCLISILEMQETPYDIDYEDKILFIETPEGDDFTKGTPLKEVHEQLKVFKAKGVFEKINGLIVGIPFGYSQEETNALKTLIKQITSEFVFPILFGANIGHADPIITVPLGVEVELNSETNTFSVLESGVQ